MKRIGGSLAKQVKLTFSKEFERVCTDLSTENVNNSKPYKVFRKRYKPYKIRGLKKNRKVL
jgi:hypothetical protein